MLIKILNKGTQACSKNKEFWAEGDKISVEGA
jgi:hypothetical protein